MDPSDSLPAPRDFGSRLIREVFARRGLPGRVSPVPHRPFEACRRPYPGEDQRPFRNRGAVRGLRRDMSGSALPNTFRLIMCRGCSVHRVAARFFAPSKEAFDAPLGPRSLPRRLVPATGRSGAYPDRTSTGWDCAAFRTHHGFILSHGSFMMKV